MALKAEFLSIFADYSQNRVFCVLFNNNLLYVLIDNWHERCCDWLFRINVCQHV